MEYAAATRCAEVSGQHLVRPTCATRAGDSRKRCDLNAPARLAAYLPSRQTQMVARTFSKRMPGTQKTAPAWGRGASAVGPSMGARAGATVAWPARDSNSPASKLPPRVYRPAGRNLPRAQSPSARPETPPKTRRIGASELPPNCPSTRASTARIHNSCTRAAQLRHSYATATSQLRLPPKDWQRNHV